MIRRKLVALMAVAIIGVVHVAGAQSPQTKKIRQALAAATADTSRVLLLADLSATYRYSRFDSVHHYAKQGLLLARRIGYQKGEGRCLSRIGILYSERGNLPQALRVDLQALSLNEAAHDLEGTARTLNQTGLLYYALEDYQPSLSYYFRSLRLYEQLANSDPSQVISVLTNIGASYEGKGQLDSATYFLRKAWRLTRTSPAVHRSCWGNPAPYVLRELGLLEVSLHHPTIALACYRRSAQAAAPENDLRSASRSYQYIAELYQQSNQLDSCVFYARKALALSQSLPFVLSVVRSSKLLTASFKTLNQGDSTLKYMSIMLMAQDSLYNPKRIKQLDAIGFAEQQRLRQLEDEQKAYVARVRLIAVLAGVSGLLLLISLLWRNNRQQQRANKRLQDLNERVTHQADELMAQRDSVARTLQELKITQGQLVLREKMASLGELMAGVAYEIQNPVNSVRKYAAISAELCQEVMVELAHTNFPLEDKELVDEMLQNLGRNQEKIMHHSQRAESIVRGMLEYSHVGKQPRQATNLNQLAEEYLRLTYHDMRAKHHLFNVALLLYPDPNVGWVNVIRQDLGRALVGIFTTALSAVHQRLLQGDEDYIPQIAITTKRVNDEVEIYVKANGVGLSKATQQTLFQRFPASESTSESTLGLALSHDLITKGYNGKVSVCSSDEEFTEYLIWLPLPLVA
ncbi:tetratricopeptide repeat protein [Hymenobacter wooponensis]|uniref:Tetratricopeptide repeat protein n=1 Tax=Hymenobacter wooponensis TaxID=1525360 RepID=A0A4Z0MKG6_9BACT|nr:tetratricopeptide repeat protein [Hymenobacter wooponensis]TGD80273.1 tetratricopeptide repeat protein [Hymenobacter wooponensis]